MILLKCTRKLAFVCTALLLVMCICSIASACPGCKDALAANDPEQARIARGYFWIILFMMSMPFALLGTFGTYVYIEVRRARADREQIADRDAEAQSPGERASTDEIR